MFNLITLLLPLFLTALSACSSFIAKDEDEIKYAPHPVTERYMTDKANISRSYKANIDTSIRNLTDGSQDNDRAFNYQRVAEDYLKYAKNEDLDDFIKIQTDTILYNSDSLLCVAIIDIISNINDFDKQSDSRFDSYALICCRDSISGLFKLYPAPEMKGTLMESHYRFRDKKSAEKVCNDMIHDMICFYLEETGIKTEDGQFIHGGINSPEYFEKSVIFSKNRFGYYIFQYYQYYDGYSETSYPFYFYSNSTDYLKNSKS